MNDRILQTANWIVFGFGIVLGVLLIVVLSRMLKRTANRRAASSDPSRAVDSSNDQQFMLATFQGVIQRQKEQERELERLRRLEKERADLSQNINENITRNMPTGLITIDRSGIIGSSNPAAKEILQRKLLEKMRFGEVLPAAPAFAPMVESCLKTGQRFHRVEMEVLLGGSQHKTLGISISPIESAKDEISGVVCLISDLTELAALQKQVRLKEGLALLGEMSAGIAHEFKNSLATISGYVQMMGNDGLAPAVENSLKMIRRETTQLTSTINKFLNFAKPQQLNRQELNLGQLLRDSLDEIRRDIRFQHIEYSFEGNARIYAGDESLLRSVFNNLLLNASEAIEPEANLGQVSCKLLDLVGDKAHKTLVKIIDNGCGVASEDLQRIFIPFFTSKSSGSGLGLAIVQKMVLMHDGKIEIESKPGDGTCVNVYL
ncbi:MAG: ATP-binding protein [Acidobacteria bacterium]|nr:ATP-binding protein [Acidobacteriota bacterium]MCI0623903.1 ATP-binding protein [Acidobacteriota bacterium]MCI0722736.1 ATP-binding protein [Acidobacteriota bacterium]